MKRKSAGLFCTEQTLATSRHETRLLKSYAGTVRNWRDIGPSGEEVSAHCLFRPAAYAYLDIILAMATLYQMLGQVVRSEDPKVMLAKIQDFERTFEQRYGRKMTDYELSMLKAAREIVDRELWAADNLKQKLSSPRWQLLILSKTVQNLLT